MENLEIETIICIAIIVALICVSVIMHLKMWKKREAAVVANNAKTEFLSRMSHDIRTPINGILCMADIALKHPEDEYKVIDCLNKITESAEHLLSLVNDVLDLSRIESGKMEISKNPMNLSKICEQSATIVSSQLALRDIKFTCDYSAVKGETVLGDELHLRQMLVNVLGNSMKFTPDGGAIKFIVSKETVNTTKTGEISDNNEGDTSSSGTVYRFVIEDTGIGMKPEYIPHIFERFSKEYDSTASGYEGTGLGMPIAKKFVDMMGGDIQVFSEYKKGTKVVIDIPLDIVENEGDENLDDQADDEAVSLEGVKFLVVEDNAINLEIAIDELTYEGAIVKGVTNGKLAVDELLNNPPHTYDIVLMDMRMPVMDGLTATKLIRESNREDLKKIPIAALSASAYEDEVARAKEAGVDEYMTKPIKPEYAVKLLARLK